MPNLGRIERIDDLRTIWPHEARDFSKWLSQEENLSLLSEEIGINLVLEELEASAGSFSIDLYATEEGTGRKVIIENQLEDTNHDHLGKIITYASVKGADIVIWIVKKARDEHKQAVEWLNQRTDESIGFFLLEMELWKIGESLPAPKFNIVERPNDWVKAVRAAEGLSDTKKLQLEFWQAFSEYAFQREDFREVFSQRKAQPQHWYDLSVGNASMRITLCVNTQKKQIDAGIYISKNKELFDRFKAHQEEIEAALDMSLDWRIADQDCRIRAYHNGDIKKGSGAWPRLFDWLCDVALKLRDIISVYDQ